MVVTCHKMSFHRLVHAHHHHRTAAAASGRHDPPPARCAPESAAPRVALIASSPLARRCALLVDEKAHYVSHSNRTPLRKAASVLVI